MENTFSAKHRSNILDDMENNPLDLIVIGGGITGCGTALDAQARGLKTGLIEMQDYAAGTSSRSTKLIHGGLRYLKQLEVKLVAEVGKERAIVYENAPHVTTPIWMMLPIFKDGTFGKLSTSFGLKVYDFLAGVKKSERRKNLNVTSTIKKEPLLLKDGLQGSCFYVEYRTDDARLTVEIVKKAVELGVKAVNYTKVEKFLYRNGKVVGVQVVDLTTGDVRNLYAKKIINAAGPWSDTLREKDKSKKGKYLHLTKGVHIVIDGEKFPLKEAIYFDTPFKDGRMVFAIPRDGKAYIGTTDTFYNENIEHPRMTSEDRDYILAATNYMFPGLNLTKNDVESSWTGLRPLIHEEGKGPSEISRKDELFYSQSGLVTIAGGKLTGYRKMAEKVVNYVVEQLKNEEGLNYPSCPTEKLKLSGGDVGGSSNFEKYSKEKAFEGVRVGLTEEEAIRIVKQYGSNADKVFTIINDIPDQLKQYNLPLDLTGMLLYGIEQEMVVHPNDFFIRRSGMLFFDIDRVKEYKTAVIDFMSAYFNWSKEVEDRYTDELNMQIHDAVIPIDEEEKIEEQEVKEEKAQ